MPHVLAVVEQLWHRLPGGTARSTERTLAALAADGDWTVTGIAARHGADHAPSNPLPAEVELVHSRLPRPALYEGWLRLGRPSVDRWCRADTVVWASSLVVPATTRPVVSTVHDLDFLTHPDYLTPRGRRFFPRMWTAASARSERFVCPSSVVAADVVAHGIDPDRVDVVPWGVDPPRVTSDVADDILERLDLEPGYVLVVAGMMPRKNPEGIAAAVAAVDRHVVFVGATGPLPSLAPGLRDLNHRLTWLPDVDDDLLSALYRRASALLYPSRAEGFGLPVLEAMVHGTAVVTSHGTATEEVAGDAALLVDPDDHESIIDALTRILADDDLRRELETRGEQRAAGFTWADTAAGYRDIFARVAASELTRQ